VKKVKTLKGENPSTIKLLHCMKFTSGVVPRTSKGDDRYTGKPHGKTRSPGIRKRPTANKQSRKPKKLQFVERDLQNLFIKYTGRNVKKLPEEIIKTPRNPGARR
jgi:hypothetical protein